MGENEPIELKDAGANFFSSQDTIQAKLLGKSIVATVSPTGLGQHSSEPQYQV